MFQVVSVHSDGKMQKYLKNLAKTKARMKCGILSGATYPDGMSVATIAYINENGEMGNPRRPFMQRTLDKNKDKWVKGIQNTVKGNVTPATIKKAYEYAGMAAKGDMVKTIKDWSPNDPRPNAPATIERKAKKGRNGKNLKAGDPHRVLIDSTTMISSIDYEVES